jgi:hypothetical protein
VSAAAAAPPAPPPSLHAELGRVLFMNNGTTTSADRFEYVPMKISYNEPDNVSCSMCGWAVHTPWNYLWQTKPGKAPPPPPLPPPPPPGTDEPLDVCKAACCKLKGCTGFLLEMHSDSAAASCKVGKPCCWFKTGPLHKSASKPAAVNATLYKVASSSQFGLCNVVKTVCTDCDLAGHGVGTAMNPLHPHGGPGPTAPDWVVPPPMGMRSSPALGGVTAGSTSPRHQRHSDTALCIPLSVLHTKHTGGASQ